MAKCIRDCRHDIFKWCRTEPREGFTNDIHANIHAKNRLREVINHNTMVH